MAIEFDGKSIETTETGFLVNDKDWSEGLATHLAKEINIELTDRHWDLINYLREAFFASTSTQPNTRTIVKAMGKEWGEKVSSGDVYDLFGGDPSKIAGRLAGLPESRRKGGY